MILGWATGMYLRVHVAEERINDIRTNNDYQEWVDKTYIHRGHVGTYGPHKFHPTDRPLHHSHWQGLFDDEAIIFALTTFYGDPEISVVLAQAVLHIWADIQSTKAPTALDIAFFFEKPRHGRGY